MEDDRDIRETVQEALEEVLGADAHVRAKAEALKAWACLQKPIKLSVLFETVARAIQP